MSALRDAVQTWADEQTAEDYTGALEDLTQHGCESGMVGHLIYYADTVAFYVEHADEIDELLQEVCEDCGLRPDELFGEKWDKTDPLARADYNRNLLAWFGFETWAGRINEGWAD